VSEVKAPSTKEDMVVAKKIILKVDEEIIEVDAYENKIRARIKGDDSKEIIVDLKEPSDKDNRTIHYVNNEKNYHVSLCCKDINAMIKIRKMMFPDFSKDTDLQLISTNSMNNRGGFATFVYKAEFQNADAIVEFSKEAQSELEESIMYLDFIDFIKSVDFGAMGVPNFSLEAVRGFLDKSEDLGLLSYLEVWDRPLYSLESINDEEVSLSIFEVDESKEKKGWDTFIQELL
tara:strand:- start:2571 stop:3266 length:696 start_codon:yes stop_codon:yes gene_type:complete